MKTFPFIFNYLINFLNSLLSTIFQKRLLFPVSIVYLADVRTGGMGIVSARGLLQSNAVGAAL